MSYPLLDRVGEMPAEQQAAFEHVLSAMEQLDAREIEMIASEVEAALDEAVGELEASSDFTGEPAITSLDRAKLRARSLARFFARRRELLAGSYTTTEVAELLGTSRQTPHDRVKAGKLLAIVDRGALRFPFWQFDPQAPGGVLPGLAEALDAMGQVGPLTKAAWLIERRQVFEGDSAVDLLRRGDVERVLAEARAVAAG